MATPIAYGADWSARPIYGDTLSRYRYTTPDGTQHRLSLVLRYADFPGQRLSYLTATEYESHLAAGIRSLLIYQRTTRDPDGGEPRGREFGRAAVAYARKIGYRAGEPIFATADAPIGAYNLDVAEAFFRGFAAEVRAAGFMAGGYGFRDVIYRLQDRGVVDVLWLCGAESGWRPGIAIYQWNNGRIWPDGVECDLVKQFEPIGDDDMPSAQEVAQAVWDHAMAETWVDENAQPQPARAWLVGAHLQTQNIPEQVWGAQLADWTSKTDPQYTAQARAWVVGANLRADAAIAALTVVAEQVGTGGLDVDAIMRRIDESIEQGITESLGSLRIVRDGPTDTAAAENTEQD